MARIPRWIAFGAVALVALSAGLFFHLWSQPVEPERDPAEVLLATQLPDVAGTAQAIEQWRGSVLVVNFWATWCPPCLKEIPEFVRLQARYAAQGVQFVGIAIDDPGRVAAFVAQHGVNYPNLIAEKIGLDLVRAAGNRLGGLPFTVVIDRRGRTARVELGVLDEKKLAPLLDSLL
jgi:thiol-disulfide isomerase/thioredoxin